MHVELDPQRVAGFGMTLDDLRFACRRATLSLRPAHCCPTSRNTGAGRDLPQQREDVAGMVVGMFDGRPVYLSDIAEVSAGADTPEEYSWFASGPAAEQIGLEPVARAPSVTIAIAKKPGTNATRIANAVNERFLQLQETVIPEGVNVTSHATTVRQPMTRHRS